MPCQTHRWPNLAANVETLHGAIRGLLPGGTWEAMGKLPSPGAMCFESPQVAYPYTNPPLSTLIRTLTLFALKGRAARARRLFSKTDVMVLRLLLPHNGDFFSSLVFATVAHSAPLLGKP